MSGYISAQEVAAQLRVSQARVRQMVDEGKLPRPTVLGDRAHVWHRFDVEYVAATKEGRSLTANSGLLADADAPLTRTFDTVLDYATRWISAQTHVRIWEGHAPEGFRAVVVIGALAGQPWPGNDIETVAAVLNDQLGGKGAAAAWFTYSPPTPGTFDGKHEANNVVLELARPQTLRRRALRRPETGRPADESPTFTNPAWREITVADIERVVGEAVECYPTAAYTPHEIARYKRQGVTVDVEHDPAGERKLLSTLDRLERVPMSDIFSPTARRACPEVALEIVARAETLAEQNWDDGTKPPAGTDPASWPTLFAARHVPLQRTTRGTDNLNSYPLDRTWPMPPETAAAKVALLHDLHGWLDDCDQHGDHPDDTLAQAVRQAAEIVHFWLGTADPTALRSVVYPASEARLFSIVGDHDRRYLNSVNWQPPAAESRAHRMIREKAFSKTELEFGQDPFGRIVARDNANQDMIVDWPIAAPGASIPAGSLIVADNGDSAGSRPVYIQRPDGRLDLLPRQPRRAANSWSFGYGGGGPGALVEAIIDIFALVDNVSQDRLPYGWINYQVCHNDRSTLRISVDELRHLIAPAGSTNRPR